MRGPGGFHWEDLYPVKGGKEGFETVSNPFAHPFKAGIKKGLDFSMPMMTNADGTPRLPGVGAGTKEYVYNHGKSDIVGATYIIDQIRKKASIRMGTDVRDEGSN